MPTILKLPVATDPDAGIPVPLGRRVELPGRGITFVREVPGPPGAPTVVLLHGWIASGGINWFQVFEPLSRHFRIIAPDLRGHGRGLRSNRRFRLADCADDVACTMEALDIDDAIVVGYSMGGPVAQLLWRRHRSKVAGLVLAATSNNFVPGMRARLTFTTMMAAMAGTSRVGQLASMLPRSIAQQFAPVRASERPDTLQRWAAAEMRRHDLRMILEAGQAIGHFHAKWVHEIDVPAACIITTRDRAVTPAQQAKMAFAIPGASIFRVEDGHVVCASPEFAAPVVDACIDVAVKAYPGWFPERRRAAR